MMLNMARTPRGLPDLSTPYSGGARLKAGTVMADAEGDDWIVILDENASSRDRYYWSRVRYQNKRQLLATDRQKKSHKLRALIFYALALFTALLCYALAQSFWFIMLPVAVVFGVIGFVFHRKYMWEKERRQWTRYRDDQ